LSSISFAQLKRTTWKIDNLKKIGGFQTTILGEPKIIKTDKGKAVEFDGIDDGIFINTNPIEGFSAFTIEAIFRPDSGGTKEQRWFHIEQTALESRALLETRLVGEEWFLDTFLKSDENRLPLLAENFRHPLNKWYHVALVYDGSEMRHYVDGNLELSGKVNFKAMSSGKISFGVRQNKVYWFKGAIRKAGFTNRALPPKEFMKK
jgi:Concanavalin A-like lectin/glucanases superfamily